MKKKVLIIFTIIISLIIVDVKALTLGTTKGTTDQNSYIVTDKATLTITNVSSDDTLKAYKILDVFYNATSNTVTYEFTSDFKSFLAKSSTYKNLTVDEYLKLTSGDITSGSNVTSSTLDELVSKYAASLSATSTGNVMNTNGTTATGSLEAGAYLVMPTSTYRVYAPMVGNLTPTVENNSWVIKDFTINAKASDSYINLYIGDNKAKTGSFSINDKVKVITEIGIPTYPTNLGTPLVAFSFETAIAVSESSAIIKMNGETLTIKNNCYVDASDNEIFCQSNTGEFLFNSIAFGKKIVVETSMTLAEPIKIGDTGNEILSSLTYTRYANDSDTKTISDTVTIYTYGIDLLAYKKGDKTTTLSDMIFEVYKDANLTEKLGTITTDSSGKGTLAGVAEGTYYIKNTKTKSGYNLAPTTAMKVKISGSVASTTAGYYKVEIEVPEAGLLPFTGGTGTLIYTAIGVIIIASSLILFTAYSKKKVEVTE